MLPADPDYTWSLLPVDQTVARGRGATFYCFTTPKFLSNVTWLKDGRRLARGGGPISEVLTLHDVGVADVGVYSCVDGSGFRHSSNLTVIGECPEWNGVLIK